jgi:hypothetical protein
VKEQLYKTFEIVPNRRIAIPNMKGALNNEEGC